LEKKTPPIAVAVNDVAELFCQVSAFPPASNFKWQVNNSGPSTDPTSYLSATDRHHAVADSLSPMEMNEATIPNAVSMHNFKKKTSTGHVHDVPSQRKQVKVNSEQDYGAYMCWATNAVGVQENPCVYYIIPAGKNHFYYLNRSNPDDTFKFI